MFLGGVWIFFLKIRMLSDLLQNKRLFAEKFLSLQVFLSVRQLKKGGNEQKFTRAKAHACPCESCIQNSRPLVLLRPDVLINQ